jgi:hypothetical protein
VEAEVINADIWTRNLFDAPEIGGYHLRYQLRGTDIDVRPIVLSSKWEDEA